MLKFDIHCLQSKEAFLSIIFKIIGKKQGNTWIAEQFLAIWKDFICMWANGYA